jgi:hypothetical protein
MGFAGDASKGAMRTTPRRTGPIVMATVVALAACSSAATSVNDDAGPSSGQGSDAAADDARGGGDGRPDDENAPDDAHTHLTDAAKNDASTDGGTLAPRPPPGFVLCGSDSATPTQVLDACTTAQTTRQRACAAVTSGGGSYQIFCGASGVYVWAEVHGLTATRTCTVTFDGAIYTFTPPVAVNVGDYVALIGAFGQQMSGFGAVQFGPDDKAYAIEATLGVSPAKTGTVSLMIAGDTDCPGEPAGAPRVLAAVEGKWSTN